MGDGVIRDLSTCRKRSVEVRAAGGILLRPERRGRLEVATIHRPNQDDWSLPKGKLDPGEELEACAIREVFEETGYRCALGAFVGCTEYTDRRGRRKVVAYWLMDPLPGTSFSDPPVPPGEEVDDVRWMALPVARRALSYRYDRELLGLVGTGRLAKLG
jgi:8-oxo-dGTP diphosphatase